MLAPEDVIPSRTALHLLTPTLLTVIALGAICEFGIALAGNLPADDLVIERKCLEHDVEAGGTPNPELDRITCPATALAGSLRQSGDHAFEVETVKRIQRGAIIYFAQSRDKLGYRTH
jgi:hypothetical protein